MKLLAPVKASHEVAGLITAGTDELYCGLTPPGWQEKFGIAWSNRRSQLSAGVSDLDDFEALLAEAKGRPVSVALNAPYYPPGGAEVLAEFGLQLLELGAASLIVADMDLLLILLSEGCGPRLHVSSLATCNNSESAAFFSDLGVARVVLPRHLTLAEIEQIKAPGLGIEVFLLNDGCIFEEGLCATTHAAKPFCLEDGPGTEGLTAGTLERYEFWKWTLNHCGCQTSRGYPIGPCALCALPRLLQAGVESVKVVGREASLPRKVKSVEVAAMAMRIAKAGGTAGEIRQAVMALRGAEAMCQETHLCYYPDVWEQERLEESCDAG